MPDRSDVEDALASLIASSLYPGGSDHPSAIGVDCRIYRGWPVARVLESEIGRGVSHITVQPIAGSIQDRTRYSDEWQGASPPPELFATSDDVSVSFTGRAAAGTVAGVRVDGQAYAYRIRNGDSPSLVAAALAALVRVNRAAIAVGPVLQVPSAEELIARIVTDGVGGREIRRQSTGFRVTLWCPSPDVRDQTAGFVDSSLAERPFFDVKGWACRLQLTGDSSTDDGSAGGIWRRDLVYAVEYPTTVSEVLPAMLFGLADVNGNTFIG